jgi:hypothetical protein
VGAIGIKGEIISLTKNRGSNTRGRRGLGSIREDELQYNIND